MVSHDPMARLFRFSQRHRMPQLPLCYNPCSCIQEIDPTQRWSPRFEKAPDSPSFPSACHLAIGRLRRQFVAAVRRPAASPTGLSSPTPSAAASTSSMRRLMCFRAAWPDCRRQYSWNDGGDAQPGRNPGFQRQQSPLFRQPVQHHQQPVGNQRRAGDLTGNTESFVVSPDSSIAYVAVPTAPVVGQSQGAIELISSMAEGFWARSTSVGPLPVDQQQRQPDSGVQF